MLVICFVRLYFYLYTSSHTRPFPNGNTIGLSCTKHTRSNIKRCLYVNQAEKVTTK